MTLFCRRLLLSALFLGAGHAAAASQQVFRCGPDGRVYSQTPCKDGYEVKADDARSAEQRKAAEDIARREEKRAEKMTRERQAREAAAGTPVVAVIANPAGWRTWRPTTPLVATTQTWPRFAAIRLSSWSSI